MQDYLHEKRFDTSAEESEPFEEWALQYVEDRWHGAILDAIDEDKTGYVTVNKLNRFVDSRPVTWR